MTAWITKALAETTNLKVIVKSMDYWRRDLSRILPSAWVLQGAYRKDNISRDGDSSRPASAWGFGEAEPSGNRQDHEDGAQRQFTRRLAAQMLVGALSSTVFFRAGSVRNFRAPGDLFLLEKELIDANEIFDESSERWDFHTGAWERMLDLEQRIGSLMPANLQELMVHAQTLAGRHQIGCLNEHPIVDAFVRGAENLLSVDARPLALDDPVLSSCREWQDAIDEVDAAEDALDHIELPTWAMTHVEFVADPEEKAQIAALQRDSGWRAAAERLWASRDRLAVIENQVSLTTASSLFGLLAQARLIARRIEPRDGFSVVARSLGMSLVRGLEGLGVSRTRNLDDWH